MLALEVASDDASEASSMRSIAEALLRFRQIAEQDHHNLKGEQRRQASPR